MLPQVVLAITYPLTAIGTSADFHLPGEFKHTSINDPYHRPRIFHRLGHVSMSAALSSVVLQRPVLAYQPETPTPTRAPAGWTNLWAGFGPALGVALLSRVATTVLVEMPLRSFSAYYREQLPARRKALKRKLQFGAGLLATGGVLGYALYSNKGVHSGGSGEINPSK